MLKLQHLLLLCVALLTSFSISAQRIGLSRSAGMSVEETISSAEVTKVMASLDKLINEYAQKADLTDESGVASQRAANDFRKLFKATARLFPDYLEYPGGQADAVSAYVGTVREKFSEGGLPFQIANAELKSIAGETFRYYIAKVQFSKSLQAYVDGKGRIRTAEKDGSRDFVLEMEVELSTEDTDRYRIRKISCAEKCGAEAADYESFMSVSADYGFLPFGQAGVSAPGNVVNAGESVDFKESINVGLGFRYTTNALSSASSEGKNLFLTAGIDLRYRVAQTELQNYSLAMFRDENVAVGIPENPNLGADTYQRLVTNVNLKEQVGITTVEIPVGFGYRLLSDNYEQSFQIQALVKPGLVISNSVSYKDGSGSFDGRIEAANYSALDVYSNPSDPSSNPFNACMCTELTRNEDNDLTTQFGLWVQLSPTYYRHLNRKDPVLGFKVSLDVAYNLISPVAFEQATSPYLENPTGENGIFANGYFDSRFSYVGVRFGLYLHRITPVNIR